MKMNYFVLGTNNMSLAVQFYDALFEGSEMKKLNDKGRMTLWGGNDTKGIKKVISLVC